MYDNYFSNFGRPPVPDEYAKIQPQPSSVLENKIFKCFFPYKCILGSKLDLAIKKSNVNV